MVDLTSVELGEAGPGDARELLSLINFIQPNVPWDERRLHWQFFEPPMGPARLWILRDGKTIVSLYCAIRQAVRTDSEIRCGWMVQDVMSHPAYRGRGFLHYLGDICFEAIRTSGDVGYTFPNKLSEGSFRRTGWNEAGKVPRRVASVRAVEPKGTQINPVESFGQTQETIWHTAGTGNGVVRDAAFLQWRYRKPGQTYERFTIANDQGFLVLKHFQEGVSPSIVHICDLVLRPQSLELLPETLAFVNGFARARGAGQITAWLPGDHPYAAAFNAGGLALDDACDRFYFTMGPGTAGPWHLTQGDSDVY